MKSIILMCVAVIITTSAFAGNNTANNTNQSSTIKSELSLSGNGTYHSSKEIHRKYRHNQLKLVLKNPFRRIELGRITRY